MQRAGSSTTPSARSSTARCPIASFQHGDLHPGNVFAVRGGCGCSTSATRSGRTRWRRSRCRGAGSTGCDRALARGRRGVRVGVGRRRRARRSSTGCSPAAMVTHVVNRALTWRGALRRRHGRGARRVGRQSEVLPRDGSRGLRARSAGRPTRPGRLAAPLGCAVTEIEIGRGKRGRRAYSFDDIAVVPSRRTRDPEEVSVGWQIDAYHFDHPRHRGADGLGDVAADGHRARQARRPAGARPRGPVDPLRGPDAAPRRDRRLDPALATARMQEIYAEDDPARAHHRAAARGPRRGRHRRRRAHPAAHPAALEDRRRRRRRPVRHPRHDGLGRARLRPRRAAQPQAVHLRARRPGHRRRRGAPTRRRCTSCAPAPPACSSGSAAAPRTRPAARSASTRRWPRRSPTSPRPVATTSTSPAAGTCTSSPTAASARSGDIVKAVACGADAVMLGAALARATDAPGRGLPLGPRGAPPRAAARRAGRGRRRRRARGDPLRPGRVADGTTNLVGALRRAMATTGYPDLKEFQRVEVVVAPYQRG